MGCYHSLVVQAEFLQAQPITALRQIVNALEDCVFLPGDIILRRGDEGHERYFLRSGKAAVFSSVEVPVWDDTEIRTLDCGCYFGEVALITGQPRSSWVLARTYCICSVLPK